MCSWFCQCNLCISEGQYTPSSLDLCPTHGCFGLQSSSWNVKRIVLRGFFSGVYGIYIDRLPGLSVSIFESRMLS